MGSLIPMSNASSYKDNSSNASTQPDFICIFSVIKAHQFSWQSHFSSPTEGIRHKMQRFFRHVFCSWQSTMAPHDRVQTHHNGSIDAIFKSDCNSYLFDTIALAKSVLMNQELYQHPCLQSSSQQLTKQKFLRHYYEVAGPLQVTSSSSKVEVKQFSRATNPSQLESSIANIDSAARLINLSDRSSSSSDSNYSISTNDTVTNTKVISIDVQSQFLAAQSTNTNLRTQCSITK
mmetsp:Transcript_6377/g.7977  ORF Transcript_6377/g.7977 Transcript_6377/m.7977 type:complete len:233 (-) Transcript_6377:24-722(-)